MHGNTKSETSTCPLRIISTHIAVGRPNFWFRRLQVQAAPISLLVSHLIKSNNFKTTFVGTKIEWLKNHDPVVCMQNRVNFAIVQKWAKQLTITKKLGQKGEVKLPGDARTYVLPSLAAEVRDIFTPANIRRWPGWVWALDNHAQKDNQDTYKDGSVKTIDHRICTSPVSSHFWQYIPEPVRYSTADMRPGPGRPASICPSSPIPIPYPWIGTTTILPAGSAYFA